MRKISDFVAKAQNEFAIFAELFRIRVFVNAVNSGDRAMPQLARYRFVGCEHEFFDQLMRFVVLDALEPNRLALWIEINFHFGEIEIERAMFKTFATQQRCKLPRGVQPPA